MARKESSLQSGKRKGGETVELLHRVVRPKNNYIQPTETERKKFLEDWC